MEQIITADERRMIDEAIEAGRVQRIPVGKSAFHVEYLWNNANSRLESEDAGCLSWLGQRNKRKRHYVAPDVAARRMRVIEDVKAGMTGAEVAQKHGVSEKTIFRDVHEMAKRGHAVSFSGSSDRSARDAVRSSYDASMTTAEIAEAAGVSKKTAAKHLRAMGLRARMAVPCSAERLERHEKIRVMMREGLSAPEISEKLGVPLGTIYHDARSMGMPFSMRAAG